MYTLEIYEIGIKLNKKFNYYLSVTKQNGKYNC